MLNTGEEKARTACESHASFVDSNEMGDCGGGFSLAHLLGLFSSDSSSQFFCWGRAGYVVDPERWDAGCAGGCVVHVSVSLEGSQPAAGPESGRAAPGWPGSSTDCSPAPAERFSLLVL